MDFNEQLRKFSNQVSEIKGKISNEEATKMSLIIPLFKILGYDVSDPDEFYPEYTAAVGTYKKEKIDYAILENGSPQILVECKKCTEPLDKHSPQLFHYYGTTTAKFGILTNGLIYQFFTDLEAENKMDLIPFLEIDIENLTDSSISNLKKFSKENFNKTNILNTAESLYYSSHIKARLKEEYEHPSAEFVRLVLDKIYKNKKSQNVVDKFTPIVQNAFSSMINEIVNERIKAALIPTPNDSQEEEMPKIITTEDELKAFYIIRGLLCELVSIEDIVYRDAQSYFSVLYADNNRKPICRIKLDGKAKWIYISKGTSANGDKDFEKLPLHSLNDLYKFKSKLILALKQYL